MSVSAELFALVHTGTEGDLDFYLDTCNGAERILELGCGHGRVLLPLARSGASVVGLDNDAGRLALARAAFERDRLPDTGRVRLIEADMRSFELDARFDRIIIPYNGLYALPSEQAQTACLSRARAHLAEDGLLIWDGYAIDPFHNALAPQDIDLDDDEPVDTIEWRGHAYLVFEHSTWLKDSQRIQVRYRYVPLEPTESIHEEVVEHCYLLTTQIDALCRAAGLHLIERFGDFSGAPLEPHSEHMVCIAGADSNDVTA